MGFLFTYLLINYILILEVFQRLLIKGNNIVELGKLAKIQEKNFPRRYALISVKGVQKLACFLNEEWIIDSTCKSINELLEQGTVGEEAVKGWIAMQPTVSH